MKHDFFIASRYRNKAQVLDLLEKLRRKGKVCYCFVVSDASLSHVGGIKDNPEEQMKKFEAIENWREDKGIQEIFASDMDGLRDSDNFILLLPAGKSAHLEAGAAYGMGKKCILIGEQKETESNYLMFNEVYPTIDAFIESL